MKIERPRICKSCGSFHIVHIWQLEGGEGRSICICLIVCVCVCICLCVSVFVFVFVLVYLYCSSAATGRREEDPPFFFIRCSFATRPLVWLLVGSRADYLFLLIFNAATNQQNRKQQINICNRLAGRCRSNGRFIRGVDKETALPSQLV